MDFTTTTSPPPQHPTTLNKACITYRKVWHVLVKNRGRNVKDEDPLSKVGVSVVEMLCYTLFGQDFMRVKRLHLTHCLFLTFLCVECLQQFYRIKTDSFSSSFRACRARKGVCALHQVLAVQVSSLIATCNFSRSIKVA